MSGRLLQFSGLCCLTASSWDVRIRYWRKQEKVEADSFLPIADSALTAARLRQMSRVEFPIACLRKGGEILGSIAVALSREEARPHRE